jgi:hypothetical protein
MNQTNHFFDLGYGWLCKHCSAEDTERKLSSPAYPSSRSSDGKQSQHQSHVPELPLASWTDSTRHTLKCPRCGIEETVIGSGSV